MAPHLTIQQLTKSPGMIRRNKHTPTKSYGSLSHIKHLDIQSSDPSSPVSRILHRQIHPASQRSNLVPDRRWLSSEHLVEPWVVEDRWWLAGRCSSFLDTSGHIFGQKRVYLIDRKSRKSDSDIRSAETENTPAALVSSSPAI